MVLSTFSCAHWPLISLSTDAYPQIQWIIDSFDHRFNWPRIEKQVVLFLDVYYVVRPVMIVSVLNKHRLFFFFWLSFPHQYSITVYIAFSIKSNLEMIQSTCEHVHRLYLYLMPFNMRDKHPHILVFVCVCVCFRTILHGYQGRIASSSEKYLFMFCHFLDWVVLFLFGWCIRFEYWGLWNGS